MSADKLTTDLISLGGRSPLFVGQVDPGSDIEARYEGFSTALRRAGLAVPQPMAVPMDEDTGRQLARDIVAEGLVHDALVCGNDGIAVALVHELQELGIDVPQQVSVVGWDDIRVSRYLRPGLTTVSQPVAQLGGRSGTPPPPPGGGGRGRSNRPPHEDRAPTVVWMHDDESNHHSKRRVMKNRMRTVAALTALLALVGMSACGRDDGGGTGNEPTQQEVSEGAASGSLTMWAMGTEGEKLPDLLKKFEADNPDVTVKVTPVPWESTHDKFTAAIAAGTTPDLAMVGTTWMGEFIGLDALDPTPEWIDASNFFEGAQATTVVDDTSYGVLWHVETRLVFYRTDIAEKAGITEAPTKWEGLKRHGQGHAGEGRLQVGPQPSAW